MTDDTNSTSGTGSANAGGDGAASTGGYLPQGTGRKTIKDMDDLRQAADAMNRAIGKPVLEPFWIKTHGEDMFEALANGNLRGLPFYQYGEPVLDTLASFACSTMMFDMCAREIPEAFNPADYTGRLALYPPYETDPHKDEYPFDMEECAYCTFTEFLEMAGILEREKTGREAPDCLFLCESRTGLALPVPIGMTLEWECNDLQMDIRTYRVCRRVVCAGADYANPNREDFSPELLSAEAAEVERYLVNLVQWSAEVRSTDMRRMYESYCHHIRSLRRGEEFRRRRPTS